MSWSNRPMSTFVICASLVLLSACTPRSNSEKSEPKLDSKPRVTKKTPKSDDSSTKDKSLEIAVKYFETADSIHREAWWVLSEQRLPVGKSVFGKVQRALLSSQNIKLSNKSMFRCDRYLTQRDVKGLTGYPQSILVFEKCSEKAEAKKLALIENPREGLIQVRFYPIALEEVLGTGASFLNKEIACELKGDEKGLLVELDCRDFSQDRSNTQMVRLEKYHYKKDQKNMIQLRGKIFENLSELRSVEANIPLDGKITVTETELYAPEEEVPVVDPKKQGPNQEASAKAAAPHTKDAANPGVAPSALPQAPRGRGAPPQQITDAEVAQLPELGPEAVTPLNLPPPQAQDPAALGVETYYDEDGNPVMFNPHAADQGYPSDPDYDSYQTMEHGEPVLAPRGGGTDGR